MIPLSVICIFCEDIREEKTGQDIIVGTLPDTLNIQAPPPPTETATAMIPRMGFYIRAHLDPNGAEPTDVSARVENASGVVVASVIWARDVIERAFRDTKTAQLPYVGLLSKIVAAPLPVARGRLTAIVTVDGIDHIAGALNVILPTASAQPASHSPPAA